MTVSVACLVVTNRPAWRTFVLHQIEKQRGNSGISKRTIIDDDAGSIPEKRNRVLAQAMDCDYVAWFDDDDWSHPLRLHWAIDRMERERRDVDAVGNVRSFFVDSREDLTTYPPRYRVLPYQAPEGIIFNGAVFRTSELRGLAFDEGCSIGEDTEWLMRWLGRGNDYQILGGPMQMWMCHGENVTNRAQQKSFPETMRMGTLITQEDWDLVPR